MVWRTDLQATKRHWRGWFEGMSKAFLELPIPKVKVPLRATDCVCSFSSSCLSPRALSCFLLGLDLVQGTFEKEKLIGFQCFGYLCFGRRMHNLGPKVPFAARSP